MLRRPQRIEKRQPKNSAEEARAGWVGVAMGSETNDTAVPMLNQLLADEMDTLVRDNFSGADATWWWERRMDGGVSICQELDPAALTAEMAEVFGLNKDEVNRIAVRTLGLENFDPVVLVYELSGYTPTEQAVSALSERVCTAAGLAEGTYLQLAAAIRDGSTLREDG